MKSLNFGHFDIMTGRRLKTKLDNFVEMGHHRQIYSFSNIRQLVSVRLYHHVEPMGLTAQRISMMVSAAFCNSFELSAQLLQKLKYNAKLI